MFPQMPMRLSQGASPLTWHLTPGGTCGSCQAPPAGGEGTEGVALPSHHCQLVPTGHKEGRMWAEACWRVLSKCWGNRKGEGSGLVGAGVRTSRGCRHSDGSRKVLCKEMPEPQSQSPAWQGGECRGRGICPLKPLTWQ